MDHGAAILSELQAIRHLLECLTQQDHRRRGGLTGEKRERLAVLLPVIHASVHGAIFTVTDLEQRAMHDQALAAGLQGAFGSGRSWRRSAGKLLAHCVGHEVGGFSVERRTNAREGAVWAVVETGASLRVSGAPQTRARH